MTRLVQPVGPADNVLGDSDAPVTLVEYEDFECPYCGRAYYKLADVLRIVGRELRFVAREFPLVQLHPHALLAAQAAEAAGAQGKFWPMRSILFENQGALELPDLVSYAERLALDVTRFADDIENGTHLPKIENDVRSGERSGVGGTPTLFLDGQRLDGPWNAETLTAAIRRSARREHHAHGPV